MANANNRLAVDAIIDFAEGRTFGAFSYPDANHHEQSIRLPG
jgi:hypothetical protein